MRAFSLLFLLLLSACCPHQVALPDHRSVTIWGGGADRQATLAKAIYVADAVWRDPRFHELVDEQWWLPGPDAPPMKGTDVEKALEGVSPADARYRLVWLYSFWGLFKLQFLYTTTHGETDPCDPIEIHRRWALRPHLINTVSHEVTHLVRTQGNSCSSMFTDEGFSTATQPWLVSYGVGDLAECFADNGGNAEATRACYAQILDMKRDCRTYEQCCDVAGAKAPPNVVAIRRRAPQCKTKCTTLDEECRWHSQRAPD
jgi:hypothetical protein